MLAVTRRVVLISGGTYGIGRAATLKFAENGWAVTTFGIDDRQCEGTLAALAEKGLQAQVLTADVSDAADVKRVVDGVVSREQRIDVLVNNAAVMVRGTLL